MVFTLNRCADAWTGLVMIDSNLKTSLAGFVSKPSSLLLQNDKRLYMYFISL